MIKKVVGLYFSPIGGTEMMTEALAKDVAGVLNDCSPEDISVSMYDLRDAGDINTELDDETIAVIGMPVNMGKIPLPAAKALAGLNASGAMALTAVSYGGRSYGNALYELRQRAEDTGLKVIGAGAFMINYGAVRGSQRSAAPAIDAAALSDFSKAASAKIKRLAGCDIEGLRIKPVPVEVRGRMPVHKISRISPKAAAIAQEVCEKLCLMRRRSEWFL